MKFSTLTIVLMIILILSGCVHIESPYYGVVKDAETGKPIKGVVVHIDLETGILLPTSNNAAWEDSFETITDEEGKYSLPLKMKARAPLELSSGGGLSFIKAGYFPSTIIEPSLNNTVTLYPIKYYLDFSHYKESAKKGDLEPPFIDKKPEAFAHYKEELNKMTSLKFESLGAKGAFITVPDAQFTNISCITDTDYNNSYSEPYTFGISDNVCTLFNGVSRKMMTFGSQGNIKELKDNSLIGYSLISNKKYGKHDIYANNNFLFIPNPRRFIPPNIITFPDPNVPMKVTPQKGHIVDLTGDSETQLAIEDSGLFLCYYSIRQMNNRCISIYYVFSKNDGNARFIALAQGYLYGNAQNFVISKRDREYRINKVAYASDSSGKSALTITENLYPTFPVDSEIIDFASDGRIFFIAFKSGGIKKYSLDDYGKSPLKEDRNFYNNSHDLFTDKSIASIDLGRSVSERVLYVTVGDSTVYRLSLAGVPDSQIRIIEK